MTKLQILVAPGDPARHPLAKQLSCGVRLSKKYQNRVGAGLVSAQRKGLWRHKAATYAVSHHL